MKSCWLALLLGLSQGVAVSSVLLCLCQGCCFVCVKGVALSVSRVLLCMCQGCVFLCVTGVASSVSRVSHCYKGVALSQGVSCLKVCHVRSFHDWWCRITGSCAVLSLCFFLVVVCLTWVGGDLSKFGIPIDLFRARSVVVV